MAEAHANPRPILHVEDVTDAPALDVLAEAAARHERIGLSFSGAEDVVLVALLDELPAEQRARFTVFSLDTGRLHPETYQFLEKVREHFGVALETLSPDPLLLDDFVRAKGLFSFYRDGHGECCAVRKIEPLRRYLEQQDAWVTGQRRDQSVTRVHVPQVQEDRAFHGRGDMLMKYNPLAGWSSREVWQFIRSRKLPYNALHDRGFVSIGCEPCTRAVGPHEHERAGRWWWEEATMKECGLHASNLDAGDETA